MSNEETILDYIDGEDPLETGKFIVTRNIRGFNYDLYLSNEFTGDTLMYTKLCDFLRNDVKDEDKVTIYLNSEGGCCDTAMLIVNAMNDCPGHIHVSVSSPCYSAATFIALSGDSLSFKPHTFLMFHNSSGDISGKGKESIDMHLNLDKYIQGIFQDLYYPFLTKQEIKTILKDQDVYVHWNDDDLQDRIDRHFNSQDSGVDE